MARTYAALPHEYLEEMELLNDAEFGRLIRALLKYSMTGEIPSLSGSERVLFPRVKMQEDRFQASYEELAETRSEAGKKGAEKRWGKNKSGDSSDSKPTPANGKANVANGKDSKAIPANGKDSNTETKTETDISPSYRKEDKGATPTRKPKAERHQYGEYANVLLTDEELNKLKSEFPNDWQERVERLSEYMASTGRVYKSHFATIRNWAKRDQEQKPMAQSRNRKRSIGPEPTQPLTPAQQEAQAQALAENQKQLQALLAELDD